MPLKTPNSPKISPEGTGKKKIISYTAYTYGGLPMEVKQFYKWFGEFKEDITNHVLTIVK